MKCKRWMFIEFTHRAITIDPKAILLVDGPIDTESVGPVSITHEW